MKQLTIHHIPAQADRPAQVRVGYLPREGAQPQERDCPFSFALTPEERSLIQWYLEQFLLFPWGEFRTRAQRAEALMERKGTELFDAVFSHRDAATLYARVADDLPNTRIVIHAGDPEGIALPWELMYDSQRAPYGSLVGQARAFVRSQPDLIFLPPEPKEGDTFNILMVICRPGGPDNDVAFQSVARPLLELFRPHRDRIHLDILRPPTFEQLAKTLNDRPGFYHVLHFDGHGTFPQGTGADPSRYYAQEGAQGRLSFEGEDGKARLVTGEEIGRLLVSRTAPIVLLNACQSGMTHPEAVYPSVGNQLLKAGASGVVAMSYSVYVQTAVRFMARLYEGLIRGEELARAVSLAREDLRAHPQRKSAVGEVSLQDWVVPVLFEAGTVTATSRPIPGLRLRTNLLKDEQAAAGTEIACPPPPDFGFIGRDGAMLDLERAFQTKTIVLLQGMAGVGKTEAAMGFARWRAETGGLNGPIFFFSFEHHLPLAQVCDRVGQVFQQVLQQQWKVEWSLLEAEPRRKLALDLLKQIPCLLIWDNFEPVAGFPAGTPSAWTQEEQQELRGFLQDLAGGATKALLTSRREEKWLGGIYRLVELRGLTLAEAQELAVRVLENSLSAAQISALPDYNALLLYLRGNPLAIRTILPELKRTQPDALLKALQAGEVSLPQDDAELGRERSLFASLTYRLDTLDPTLRQRLGLLWLFQGFVNAQILALMCREDVDPPDLLKGLQAEEWLRMLDTAAELGLLRRVGSGYYTVHPALPWFFHDLAQEVFPDKQETLERTFAGVYSQYGQFLFRTFNTNTHIAMQLLQAEENNLLYALRLARRHGQWNDAAGILYGLNQLWTTQARWLEWERLVGELETDTMDAAGKAREGREELWLALLGHRQEIASYRRDFLTQETILNRLRVHYEQAGDDHNHAVSLHQLGMIAQERRSFDEAEQWYRKSLEIEVRIGDEHGQANSLGQLGNLAYERRQFEEAENWYRKSLEIEERIGDEHGQATTLHQLGMIAQERRLFEEAEQWHRKSLEINERIGDEQGQAMSFHLLGSIAVARLAFEEAEQWYRQALSILERIEDEHTKAMTLHQLGNIAYLRRLFEEAEQWYRKSLEINERIGDKHGQAITLGNLGRVAQERRLYEEAEQWYRKSLEIQERIGDEHGQAGTLHQLGRIAEERGQPEEALGFYAAAEAMYVRLNDPHTLSIVRGSLQRVRGGHHPQPPPPQGGGGQPESTE